MAKTVIQYEQGEAQHFVEDLGNGVELDMVLIPDVTFTMGAPETEEDSNDSERPQHLVTVPSFFMSRYPITQAQWRAVASMEHLRVWEVSSVALYTLFMFPFTLFSIQPTVT